MIFFKKKIRDITQFSGQIGDIKVDFRSSWLNPEKIRRIIIIGKKKNAFVDQRTGFSKSNKIFNKYAEYPKITKFKKKFFTQKAYIYLGKTIIPKVKFKSPLENEMLEFLRCLNNKKKPFTSTKIAMNVLKILEKLN